MPPKLPTTETPRHRECKSKLRFSKTFSNYLRASVPLWFKIVRAIVGVVFLLALSTPTQFLFADDAKELLQKFVDRWEAIKEFDVEIVADIEYSSINMYTKAEAVGATRRNLIRFAKSEGRSYLSVDTTSSICGTNSYQTLEIGHKQWFIDKKGQATAGSDQMVSGGAVFNFLDSLSLQVDPFCPWWLTIAGDDALRGRNNPRISEVLLVDKILESSSAEKGTHVIVSTPKGMNVYEFIFDKEFDGLPSMISFFPNHGKINLKDPSSNTRYFYRSTLEWRKSKNGWFVSRVVVNSLDGRPEDTDNVQFDSEWHWSNTVDESLFEPPTAITK